jgi:hypothetical protein
MVAEPREDMTDFEFSMPATTAIPFPAGRALRNAAVVSSFLMDIFLSQGRGGFSAIFTGAPSCLI